MTQKIPNIQLRAWRDAHHLTRVEMADALNRTDTAMQARLTCDEKRLARWETGEVLWPHAVYRRALHELTGRDAEDLGFIPRQRRDERSRAAVAAVSRDALQAEAEIFDTLDLTRLAEISDIGAGTVEALNETADLLCRAYPDTPAAALRDRTKRRLQHVIGLLGGRSTLDQHRELLIISGWLSVLLGCLHYDLGEREEAEAARQAAFQWAKQAGHSELMGWAFEMSAWFALVEGRYEQLIEFAQAGQSIAGSGSAGVQLILQEAKGWSRIGDHRQAEAALNRGAAMLGSMPLPAHAEHHFMFDHAKWMHYAASCYVLLGDNDRAEEHALEVITQHGRPDGTTNAPMRTAQARMNLAIVAARRGQLDLAVAYGESAFEYERQSLADLASISADLDIILQQRYRGEQLAREFHERHLHIRRVLDARQAGRASPGTQ
jgi:transcriptional regulator with XRE-family HTH domain